MAVEIVSLSDPMFDARRKVAKYLRYGTPLVVVEPRRRTATLHRPGQAPVTIHEDGVIGALDVLPGFRLPVAQLFA